MVQNSKHTGITYLGVKIVIMVDPKYQVDIIPCRSSKQCCVNICFITKPGKLMKKSRLRDFLTLFIGLKVPYVKYVRPRDELNFSSSIVPMSG